eukprot:TRINITY_DN21981_c0_g1_i1.p1 TRINITY_DN21981_c0_g1~~TRINITY_DN21981_c0_g1_i1.p1  ORF type:complete len:662 (-),score=102.55 TRINITY_DN21981_c0_g1_i1:96-1823(-)
MSRSSAWMAITKGPMMAIAAHGNVLYGVNDDYRVYQQRLSALSPESTWTVTSQGSVLDIAFSGDHIYAAGVDRQVWKQLLSNMTVKTQWVLAGQGSIFSIAIEGDHIYGVGQGGNVFRQTLSAMSPSTTWEMASKGAVERIDTYAGTIYGCASDARIWRQDLATMTTETDWRQCSQGDVTAVAMSSRGVLRPRSAAIEFLSGNVLDSNQWSSATVLYVSSHRFSSEVMTALAWEIATKMKPGAIVFTEREIPGCYPGLVFVQRIVVPTSWALSGAEVAMYIVLPPPGAPRPSWLVTKVPEATDAFSAEVTMDAIVDSSGVPTEESMERWLGAADRTWQGQHCGHVALRRVLNAAVRVAPPALGSSDADNATSATQALQYVLRGQLHVDGFGEYFSVLGCAWDTLVNRGRFANLTGVDRRIDPEDLFEHFATPDMTDEHGRNLAWLAANDPDSTPAAQALSSLVSALSKNSAVDHVAFVNTPDSQGLRPLGVAIRSGHLEAAKVLLSARARVDAEEGEKRQPLHVAALYGRLNITQLLLENGASLTARDAGGLAPWQLAPLDGKELLSLLGASVQE